MDTKTSKNNAAVKVDSNVTIKTLNENDEVIKVANVHNKATMHMVSGLLEFLSGAFTPVITNNEVEYTTPDEISSYVPVALHLGTVGVKMTDRKSNKPKLTGINRSEFKIPTFDDYKLQNDITQYYTTVTEGGVDNGINFKFDTVAITSFDDSNNSMGLLLQLKLPAGRTIGVGTGNDRQYFIDNIPEIGSGHGWVYYNESKEAYEAIYTELGLFSDTGNLLARVLLNGETTVTSDGEIIYDDDSSDLNPITQSDKTSLVIEWRIGIISLGQNDYVFSETSTIPQPDPEDPSAVSIRNTFRKCIDGSIYTIYVPDGTKQIREYCFYDLSSAKTLVLPKELGKNLDVTEQVIKPHAFHGISLDAIYYKGSLEEWDEYVAERISDEDNGNITSFLVDSTKQDAFTGDGNAREFVLSDTVHNIDTVKVNGIVIDPDYYSYYINSYSQYVLKFTYSPANNSEIIVDYTTLNKISYNYAEQEG